MDSLDFWRLCDELSVIQAALLIAGVDPSSEVGSQCENWREHEQPTGYVAAKNALIRAIQAGRLRAVLRYDAEPRYCAGIDNLLERGYWGGEDAREVTDQKGDGYVIGPVPNWHGSSVEVEDLKNWLRSRGFTSGFFFPNETAGVPGYLDPNNPRYAPKLAATVAAWLAVTDQGGKTPKQALEKWLRENAAQFGLTRDDGMPADLAVTECSKVANWQLGGPPKTPG